MGVELLAPLAKWGAALIAGFGAIAFAWYQTKKGIRADVKLEQAVAELEARDALSVRHSSIRETRAQRRTRLERIVRESTES